MDRHLRPIETQEALLTREGLASLWNCDPHTIDRMREQGMPSIKWGRRFVRFRVSECMEWLDEQNRRAA